MNQYYDELVILLSMISERTIPKKMDKASTLHEAVRCLRTYAELTPPGKIPLLKPKGKSKKGANKVVKDLEIEGLYPKLVSAGEALQSFLDAHDTFLILVSDSGHILYATELITTLLGHMQTRLVGQNLFDYVLESEKTVLLEMFDPGDATPSVLAPPNGKVLSYPVRSLQCHFKLYTGETGSLTQHLPFICLSYLRRWKDTEEPSSPPMSPFMELNNSAGGETESYPLPGGGGGGMTNPRQQSYVLLLGKLPTNLTLLDLPLGVNDVDFSFDMRVSKNGNIINIDSHAVLVLGFTISEIVGSHFFDYIDPYHLLDVGERMGDIFTNTRGSTNPYRFHTKGGRYVWLLSKGYLSYNPWNHKPDHILLSSRVLGCDHVVPEFRFFRSRSLLPDVCSSDGELYNPPPLSQTAPSPPKSPPPPLWQQSIAGSIFDTPSILNPLLQGDYLSNDTSASSIPQQHQHHVKPESVSATPLTRQCGAQARGRSATRTPPNTATTAQQQQNRGGNMAASVNRPPSVMHGAQSQQQLQHSQMAASLPPNLLIDFQQEMEKKNNELFDMQRRLLEQQMLMECERNQFYQVAQQVMQCIGTSGGSALPPNLRVPGFPVQAEHTRPQTDNPSQNLPDPYSFLSSVAPPSTQSKPPATVSTPLPSSGGFPTSANSAALMQSRKLSGNDNSPYSMLLAQSHVGMLGQNTAALGNSLGQQSQQQWQQGGGISAATPTTARQHQQLKQSQSHPNKPTGSLSVENSPYSMLFGGSAGGLTGNLPLPGSMPQQHNWPLPMPDSLQQRTQMLPMGQTWNQKHPFQGQDKSASAPESRSSIASHPPSSYTLPSAEQLMGAVVQSSTTIGQFQQHRGWPPAGQQHGWPGNTPSAQQKPSGNPATTSGENSPYSMLLQNRGSVSQSGPITQQQGWPGSVPTSSTNSSHHSKQQTPQLSPAPAQSNHYPNPLQRSQPSMPSLRPGFAPPGSDPCTSTITSALLQTPSTELASQLKMTSFQPLLPGVTTPNLPHPSSSSSSSQTSQQQQPTQSTDSLPIRLPSDEEIQTLLDNIQMKCSSTTIPGLSTSDFP